MSCPSSQNPLILTVAMGNLPEGFCPATIQEMFNIAIARVIISPSEASLTIVGGGTEPASNVGPWMKNCEELFFFDDVLARYRPMIVRGALNNFQPFTASGDFIVPDNVFKIKAEAWGGGGGGHAASQGSGGGGGYGMIIRDVVPGQVIPIVVGTGGAPSSPGTASTILGMSAGGGQISAINQPSSGGVVTGADFGIQGYYSSSSASAAGFPGHPGAAPQGGGGGAWNSADPTYSNGLIPGGGGAGFATFPTPAGSGARGQINIWY